MKGRNVVNLKSSGEIETGPLLLGSLLSRDERHHDDVGQLGRSAGGVAHGRNDRVDADHTAVPAQAAPAIVQEPDTLLVLPVVDDVLQNVNVRRRNRSEHISGREFHAVGNRRVTVRETLTGYWNKVWNIEHGGS